MHLFWAVERPQDLHCAEQVETLPTTCRPLYRPHADLFTDHIPNTLPTTYRHLDRLHADLLTDHIPTSLPTSLPTTYRPLDRPLDRPHADHLMLKQNMRALMCCCCCCCCCCSHVFVSFIDWKLCLSWITLKLVEHKHKRKQYEKRAWLKPIRGDFYNMFFVLGGDHHTSWALSKVCKLVRVEIHSWFHKTVG